MSLTVHLALVFHIFHCFGRHGHGLCPSWFVAVMVQARCGYCYYGTKQRVLNNDDNGLLFRKPYDHTKLGKSKVD